MALGMQGIFRGFSKTNCASSISVFYHENSFSVYNKFRIFKRLLSTKPGSSTPASANPSSQSLEKRNPFITIYKMPYIRYPSVIQKLKIQQTVFTLIATPISSTLAYNGHLTAGTGWVVGSIGFLLCTFLYSLGFFCTNVVGFVYVSADNSTVRISYVDGWGRRVDDDIPLEDLVPMSELPKSFLAPLYIKLQRYSKQKRGGLYKINVTDAAQITDQERFTYVFGKIEL